MAKSVVDYQNAYKEITDILIKNTNILSIFVFGSMVSGDLWEGSNIDLFAIYNEEFDEIRDLHSEVLEIPVHIKFLSKKAFKSYYNEPGKINLIKDYLISSRLIYSVDSEITDLYQKIIYMIDSDKGRWNLVYLGKFLKEVLICKKYLSKGSGYTAHELLIRALNNFSMIYLSINGYNVSKDSLSMACNLNDNLNDRVEKLLYSDASDESIRDLVNYMEIYLEYNMEKITEDLIDFIKKQDKPLSSYEIKSNPYFKNFKIKIEEILNILYKNNIISKEKREFRDSKGSLLAMENVYSYKR